MNDKDKKEFNRTYRQACQVLNNAGIKIKRLSTDDVLWEANRSGRHDAVVAANFIAKYRRINSEINAK